MLKYENICLRAVKNSDSVFLYKAINDPKIVRYNAPFVPIHELDHQKWLAHILENKTKHLLVVEHEGQPVGYIQLLDIHPIHRTAEITIRLFDEKNCGKGLGTEAIHVMCIHAFKDLGLVRVWLRVFDNNHRAIRAYEKAGFRNEGVMRKAAFIDGNYVNIIVMAKLNDD